MSLPSQELLKSLLDYNPHTGELFWKSRPRELFENPQAHKAWNTRWAYKPAFQIKTEKGYLTGTLLGTRARAHRIIWKIMTGQEPQQIDHVNGIPSDNRWVNLRNVTPVENSRNQKIPQDNTSGVCGVSYDNSRQSWVAYINVDRRRVQLGRHPSLDDAVFARKAAEEKYGFHSNHGRKAC